MELDLWWSLLVDQTCLKDELSLIPLYSLRHNTLTFSTYILFRIKSESEKKGDWNIKDLNSPGRTHVLIMTWLSRHPLRTCRKQWRLSFRCSFLMTSGTIPINGSPILRDLDSRSRALQFYPVLVKEIQSKLVFDVWTRRIRHAILKSRNSHGRGL